jgi:6-pyruvoyltetrahydropterin/6-carboxytetrahydropterin synthase
MYSLKTESSFDAAHFLSGYDGKCRNIHGHQWKVEIEIMSEKLESEGQLRGMCVDFSTLKAELKEEVDFFDHSLIVEEGTLKKKTVEALLEEAFNIKTVKFRPTAENFAKYFYDRFKRRGYNVKKATVYETPVNCASYFE